MTAQIIPFRFDTHPVRTLLINDQPWFVAADVAIALHYRDSDKMARNLDDDEKGTQIVGTPGGDQEMTVINESGLYSAILRSRKAEAKRFKKWITAEVLPAIRKHGHYQDDEGKLGTLIGHTIGTDGFHMLGSLIKGKVTSLPVPQRRSTIAKLWSQIHTAFGVRSAADIPADQLDSARNFIAAYAIEGEWLGKDKGEETFTLTREQAMNLTHLLHSVDWVNHRWHQGIGKGVEALNRPLFSATFEHVNNMARAGRYLDRELVTIRDHFKHLGGLRPGQKNQQLKA